MWEFLSDFSLKTLLHEISSLFGYLNNISLAGCLATIIYSSVNIKGTDIHTVSRNTFDIV